MDGSHFDELTRALAGGISRRGVLRTLIGGMTATALAVRGGAVSAEAERRPCWRAGKRCGVGRLDAERCCLGVCCVSACCGEGESCASGGCCPTKQTCDDVCCPPESTGCTVLDLPDGSVVGCLCPKGTRYDRAANECRACPATGDACSTNDDCCADNCCNGACCAWDEVCSADGRCVDRACCSGIARCGRQTSDGMCCAAPQRAFCCCDSPGGMDGYVICCTPGVDCELSDCPYQGLGAWASWSPDCSVDVTADVTETVCSDVR